MDKNKDVVDGIGIVDINIVKKERRWGYFSYVLILNNENIM